MSIFSTHYDNSIVSVDTAWSPNADPVLNVKFARGPFSMDYHCLQSRFVQNFKEDCCLFVNDSGQLCMIPKLYSFAGGDYYYHIFALNGSL